MLSLIAFSAASPFPPEPLFLLALVAFIRRDELRSRLSESTRLVILFAISAFVLSL